MPAAERRRASEDIYAGTARWLIYIALAAMGVTLAIYIAADPGRVFAELSAAMEGKLKVWHPNAPQDQWALYAVMFTNTIVIIALLPALPRLARERPAAAGAALAVLVILVLAALGIVTVKE
jgi:hypothetical protein